MEIGQGALVEIVSIHTRHYWRVKHWMQWAPNTKGLFQSTPAITGG